MIGTEDVCMPYSVDFTRRLLFRMTTCILMTRWVNSTSPHCRSILSTWKLIARCWFLVLYFTAVNINTFSVSPYCGSFLLSWYILFFESLWNIFCSCFVFSIKTIFFLVASILGRFSFQFNFYFLFILIFLKMPLFIKLKLICVLQQFWLVVVV